MADNKEDDVSDSFRMLAETVTGVATRILEIRDELLDPGIDRVMELLDPVFGTVPDEDGMFRLMVQKGVIAGFFFSDEKIKEHGLLEMQTRAVDSVLRELEDTYETMGLEIKESHRRLYRILIETGVIQGFSINRCRRIEEN